MTELNVERLATLGLPATVERTRNGAPYVQARLPSGEIFAHELDGTHRVEQFHAGYEQKRADERLFAESDLNGLAMSQGLLAAAHAAKRVHEVLKDSRLSTDGRRQAVSEVIPQALASVGTEYAQVAAEGERLTAKSAMRYAVPVPDAVSDVIGSELRAKFDAMSPNQQAVTLRKLGEPEYRALALALSQSRFPLNPDVAKIVSRAWASHVDRADPAGAASLAKATAANSTAASMLKALSGALMQGFAERGRATIDRQAAYQALKPIEGAWPVDFAEGERPLLERRIAAAGA